MGNVQMQSQKAKLDKSQAMSMKLLPATIAVYAHCSNSKMTTQEPIRMPLAADARRRAQ